MSYVNDFNKLNTKEEKKLFLNSFNEERRATTAQIMYKEIYNEVIRLHEEGVINYHIAKQLNISASTVSRYLRKYSNQHANTEVN